MKDRSDSRRWALGSDGWRRGLIGLAVVAALLTLLFAAQSLAGPGKPRETRHEETGKSEVPVNVATPGETATPATGRRWTEGALSLIHISEPTRPY